jgi:uncharacterized lipoprotein YddW (UPF0748 family)
MRILFSWLLFTKISLQIFAQTTPQFEFRAVWVATVENIDWPSKKGLPVEQQKDEFIRLIDMHKRNGMNAVVMQIRPVSDAFYPSQYEPWSEYLNGKQGLPPTPYYDPLLFMIEETHKRAMEFHAWLNPYRAVFSVSRSSIAPSHVSRLFPQWFVTYGNTKYYDPGLPQVREHVNRVVRDIVSRYDLDAIHFDDYFYPYKIPGKEFPDGASYAKYGNGMNRDDWRRSNVDTIIKMLGESIKSVNPRVKFGISPFGVGAIKTKIPGAAQQRRDPLITTSYTPTYCYGSKKGWIDYITPQFYWEIGHKLCDYNVLLDWWSKNSFGKQVFIGHGIYRINEDRSPAWKSKNEIPNQIKALRQNPNVQGSVYFSSKTFSRNPNGWNDSLQNNYYKYPALPPPMRWIDNVPPVKPLMERVNRGTIRLFYRGAEPIKGFAVYAVPYNTFTTRDKATLIQLLVAEKDP